jgi:hypothetical protein
MKPNDGANMNRPWWMCVALVAVVGCGFPQAKVDEAKGHVQMALNTWKAEGKLDELAAKTPPIEFHEALWNAGDKLVSFEMGAAKYVDSAAVVRCEVKLNIRPKKGKERTETVSYDVTLTPSVKIVNNPMP